MQTVAGVFYCVFIITLILFLLSPLHMMFVRSSTLQSWLVCIIPILFCCKLLELFLEDFRADFFFPGGGGRV